MLKQATQEIEGEELERLRADTPGVAQRIHFDNAGASPSPRPVLEAMVAHLELEAQIGGYEAGEQAAPGVSAAYASLGELLGVAPDQVALVENATVGFAQALSSFDFERDDVILTTREDYISNQIMFFSLARRLGVRVERVKSLESGGLCLEDLERHLARKPRLLAMSHVPTNSGLVQPAEAAGRLARAANVPYLLDACQSVGQRPVTLADTQADFLSGTCRKFLRGPRGAGFLAVSRRVLESDMAPLYLDMRGARWSADDGYELFPGARRFENWEFSYALVLGTGEAARYALDVGLERIRRRTTALAAKLRTALQEEGLRVWDKGAEPCGIVTVEIPGAEPEAFQRKMRAAGLSGTPSLLEYGRLDFASKGIEWALRLSPHYYNTEAEIERAVEILSALRPR